MGMLAVDNLWRISAVRSFRARVVCTRDGLTQRHDLTRATLEASCCGATQGDCRMNTTTLETVWAPRLLSVLRIVTALLFIAHGTQKLFGFPASRVSPAFLSLLLDRRLSSRSSAASLILVGLFTRPVAFLLSGDDGGRLLHGARAAELLPGAERRRRCDPASASSSSTWSSPARAPGASTRRRAAGAPRRRVIGRRPALDSGGREPLSLARDPRGGMR